MQPAMSSLPGWEARASRGGALHTGDASEAPAAAGACWLAPNHEPLISPAVAGGDGGAPACVSSSAHTSLFSVPFKAEAEGSCSEASDVAEEGRGAAGIPDMIQLDSSQA